MPTESTAPPLPNAPLVRFSAGRYEELTRVGFFGPGDKIELIDGYLVEKMPQNDPHTTIVDLLSELFLRALPAEWTIRCQFPIRLRGDTIPEPDGVVVPGPKSRYRNRKPGPADIALIIEASDTSLRYDRTTKFALYARNRLPVYWIINIPSETVEVYSDPKAGRTPTYLTRTDFARGSRIPVLIDGTEVAEIEVDALFA
jgi:Uma2 family endonuclease